MSHPRAGQPAEPLRTRRRRAPVTAYYTGVPDPDDVDQQVAFGTSGTAGRRCGTAFNETHILATTQAIVDHRREQGYDGPLFLGRDTHGLSEPAWASALEVLAANDVTVLVDDRDGYTPTPAVSHAILRANGGRTTGAGLADGIVVTPSHNLPSDGGFMAQPAARRPADTDATSAIAARANELIRTGSRASRVPFARRGPRPRRTASRHVRRRPAASSSTLSTRSAQQGPHRRGPAGRCVGGLLGRDRRPARPRPHRGQPARRPHLAFHDADRGRQDPDGLLAPAMASLDRPARAVRRRDRQRRRLDRHGIVTPDAGLMNPNHYLAVAIGYLLRRRPPDWPATARIGKTLVSSSMIDRVATAIGREMVEVPVGFKWFVPGLIDGSFGFGGEESAGPSFLRRGRIGLDDRQGRHHPGAAGLRDPATTGRSRRSTTPTWSPSTASRRTPASTPGGPR